MPYIPQFRRDMMAYEKPANVGELTYVLYKQVLDYIDGARAFNRFAEVFGAIECLKHELYRKEVAAYEDGAIERNGNVA